MGLVFWRSDPLFLLGPWFPLIACAGGPAALFGFAFLLSSAGIRLHRWAVVLLLVLVVLTAAAAYWGWQAMLWGV